jgi:hypothetical protein
MNAKHSGAAKVWLLNLFGNAVLVAAVYFLLVLPDAHGWQVGMSALLAFVVIFFGVWLRAGSFAYFRLGEFRDNAKVWRPFQHSLRHLIALVLWFIPFAVAEWWLFRLRQYAPQFGVWFWQKFSALRFGNPRSIYHAADWVLWIVMLLVFALWLPVASTVAAIGLKPKRMDRAVRVVKGPAYWGWLILLLFVGLYLPSKLVWWIPDLSTLTRQAWSAGIRFFLAYLFLISAWVGLLLVAGTRADEEDSDPERRGSLDSA